METLKNKFIENSRKGLNKWYSSILLLTLCIAFFGMLNIPLNGYILPFFEKIFGTELFPKEYLYSFITGVYFWVFIAFLFLIYPVIFKISFFSLINSEHSKFRWLPFFQGFIIWGIITFLVNSQTNKVDLNTSLSKFDANTFFSILSVNIIFCSSQTFLEELFFRGYLIQVLGRNIKRYTIVNLAASLLFALIHIPYGLEAFILSFVFSFVMNKLVLKEEGIERAYGIHLANNLVFASFFGTFEKHLSQDFTIHIDWKNIALEIVTLISLFIISNFIIKRKVYKNVRK